MSPSPSQCRISAIDTFNDLYSREPRFLVRAPGRVNLIGEHTDYNEGFVMPMAINRAMWIACEPSDNDEVELYSVDMKQWCRFSLGDVHAQSVEGWGVYILAMARAMHDAGIRCRGLRGVSAGDVPPGAGLSSSAALEVAAATAFVEVTGGEYEFASLARMAQRAESEYVGVQCGIMDQMVSACARKDHALQIDCRDDSMTHIPFAASCHVVILDTMTRRELAGSEYNDRRKECARAAGHAGVGSLRDATVELLLQKVYPRDAIACRRARHVVSENDRVQKAAKALSRGDMQEMGRLMQQSHESLRDDYEVTNEALDHMVEAAVGIPGCYGARMTGAGFGGCAVALVDPVYSEEFIARVGEEYTRRTTQRPNIYTTTPQNGAEVILR